MVEVAEPKVVYVRYIDHVMFNRASPLVLQPMVRETVGWLIREEAEFIIIAHDRDAEPPTLKGGDPKATGLCLLKSAIIEMKRFE